MCLYEKTHPKLQVESTYIYESLDNDLNNKESFTVMVKILSR